MDSKKIISMILILVLLFVSACSPNNLESSNESGKEELIEEKAISLENEFMSRLFVNLDEGTGKVKGYNNKEELIANLSEVTKKSIAESYVDDYYREREDGLYIIAKDKPVRIYTDTAYKLEKTSGNYELIQEAENELRGKYKFRVKFTYKNNNWIISDRIFETIE